MIQITNLTDEPNQRHTVIFEESEIVVKLRFFPRHHFWSMDVVYGTYQVFGVKLSVGALHIESGNQPFDFTVMDNSGNGIDPYRINDFSNGRCSLYMFERADMLLIRDGEAVPA
ncbi:MAG: hypothetical protein P1P89_19715 [Desulfobacterales bacterium]|nr:hypothetical protein [Desulfobacterales bacterium]